MFQSFCNVLLHESFCVKPISIKDVCIWCGGVLLKDYCCPECTGTDVIWDRGIKRAVCPKDGTPVSDFRLAAIG